MDIPLAFNIDPQLALTFQQILRPHGIEEQPRKGCPFKSTVTGENVVVYEDWEDAGVHGNTIWDGGLALGKFFAWWDLRHGPLRGKSVLELGAGTGVGGLTAALLGARVTLTDNIEEVLALMKRNVQANKLDDNAVVRHLDWADDSSYCLEETFDFVVAADVLYDGYGGPILARAFDAHIAAGSSTVGIFAFKMRSEAPLSFFDGMVAQGFFIERLQDAQGRCVGYTHGCSPEAYDGSQFSPLPESGATEAVRTALFTDDGQIQLFRLTRPQSGASPCPPCAILEGQAAPIWRVTAHNLSKGGLLVRRGQELSSPALPDLLLKGARVAQLEVVGNRLAFRKVSGDGPVRGWVSMTFKGTPLLTCESR